MVDYSFWKGAQFLVITLAVMLGVYYACTRALEGAGGALFNAIGISANTLAALLALIVTLFADFYFVRKMISEKPPSKHKELDIDDIDASPRVVGRLAEIKYGDRKQRGGKSFGETYGFEK
ncbi:Uncharacterised protein [Candidatus Norongarragalina meridionalis]|nr:Uncharacterised protein [Candidatus Norongarragalina meridionalis]